MKEEVAIILTASAPEFGDLVPLMNCLLQVERMVFLPLKAASQMDHYQDSGTGPSEFHISFYADGLLTSLRCHQRSGVFPEGASGILLNWQHTTCAFAEHWKVLWMGVWVPGGLRADFLSLQTSDSASVRLLCAVLVESLKVLGYSFELHLKGHLLSKGGSAGCSVVSDSLRPHGLQPARLLGPWDFPGSTTGVGSHCFSRGSSLPRDWTWVSCHCTWILCHLSHQGSLILRTRNCIKQQSLGVWICGSHEGDFHFSVMRSSPSPGMWEQMIFSGVKVRYTI